MKFKKPVYVYIAGPLTHGDQFINVRRAVNTAELLKKIGFTPFCPHLGQLWHLIQPHTYEEWIEYDFSWLLKCDALYRIQGKSPGAEREVRFAEEHNIPVFTTFFELIKWARDR